jgi:diguanylate cyclase
METPDMLPTGPTASQPVAMAEAKLGRLGVQVDAMQRLLVRLLQDVVRAEHRLDNSQTAQLAEVNQQLVVAALSSRDDAAEAADALDRARVSAMFDALTGLPNRHTLMDHFALAAGQARRRDGRCALLFLDLDNFKLLNDQHGHDFGDQVLKLVARRLTAAVREVDTVSRHGGDEFLVLLSELETRADACAVAAKLVQAVALPAVIDGQAVQLSASVGVALCPDDGDDINLLIRRADAAMYTSKRQHTPHAPPLALVDDPARRPLAAGAVAPDRLLTDLRDANERLVLAALGAQQLQAAAEQACQRQTAFLSVVADELRNPMAPIRIALTMLGRPAVDEPLLPRVQQVVGQHIAQISQLVDAVSVESGGLRPGRHPIDLVRIVDQVIAAHRAGMAAREQHCTHHAPPDPLVVLGDAHRLALIVANLLDNASRYTHEGGHIALTLAAQAEAGTVTLTVVDNGIGITPALLPLVFEPFIKDPGALGHDGAGLGIGLTVARALAHAHGGQISAHSAGVSRGSRFVLTLPLLAAHEPAAAPTPSVGDTAPVP